TGSIGTGSIGTAQRRKARRAASDEKTASRDARRKPNWRVDASHAATGAAPRPHYQPRREGDLRATLARFICWLGLLGSACGAVLVGWSLVEERPDFWQIGLPTTIAGLVWLLLGFVLQLDRIGQQGRDANRSLEHVQRQFKGLQQTATMQSVAKGSAS